MSDDLESLPSFLGNEGEPVAEVHPDDLKSYWQEVRKLREKFSGQQVSVGIRAETVGKLGSDPRAVWYRAGMIWVLIRSAQERLSPHVRDGEVSDAVFRTMATIPMEWIGHTEREGLPFDVDEFFRRLSKGGVQDG